MAKKKAPRNRTLTLSPGEEKILRARLVKVTKKVALKDVLNKTLHADLFHILDFLPEKSVDLLFADPPYNLTKNFNGKTFAAMAVEKYEAWLESWLAPLKKILKPTASIYLCGDWRSSGVLQKVLERHFIVRNRIVWEREKGRGAKANWKNCSEDLWYATVSEKFTFDLDKVKIRRRVIAPYRHASGEPKDWNTTADGNFRLTHPSNLWTDISIPFWSMPENTDHPTQKPEKLLAKILLASSKEGDVVFDPFLGSGTTLVVAKKLGRCFFGVERDETYCLWAEKRLELAENDKTIQGYRDGVFWERNSGQ